MKYEEHFHTLEQYLTSGLDIFLKHTSGYLNSRLTVPVSKTSSLNGDEVLFTFSNDLLQRLYQGDKKMKKAYEKAIKYGFLGHSRGGRNGIFYQREEDNRMIRLTDRLVTSMRSQISGDLSVVENSLDDLEKVKIVYYNASGERVVGVYNTEKGRIMFLGFSKY